MLCPQAKGFFGKTFRKSSQERKDKKQNWSEGEVECSIELMEVAANSAENSEPESCGNQTAIPDVRWDAASFMNG